MRALLKMTGFHQIQTGPLLEVRDLCAGFGVRRGFWNRKNSFMEAVRGVSFDIEPGTTLGLVGESGCGKTTLGRVLLRLTPPFRGSVGFNGEDVLNARGRVLRELRRDVQVVFQDPGGSLNPRRTIGWSIAEPLIVHRVLRGANLTRRVHELLQRVGLTPSHADRYPHELSGGQRQRVAIARAISLNPKFMICDEAVSALDASIQAQILNLLSDLKRDLGLTILFIAHNLAVVECFCDRVAVMYLGEIVEIADTADLFGRPRHPYTAALLSAVLSPDPATRDQPIRVLGEIPNPLDRPAGCSFHPRCSFSADQCREVAPPLERKPSLSNRHLVACHFAEELDLSNEAILAARDVNWRT